MDSAGPACHPTEEMEIEGASIGPRQHPEGSDGKDGGEDSKDRQPLQKRFWLTEQMKNII